MEKLGRTNWAIPLTCYKIKIFFFFAQSLLETKFFIPVKKKLANHWKLCRFLFILSAFVFYSRNILKNQLKFRYSFRCHPNALISNLRFIRRLYLYIPFKIYGFPQNTYSSHTRIESQSHVEVTRASLGSEQLSHCDNCITRFGGLASNLQWNNGELVAQVIVARKKPWLSNPCVPWTTARQWWTITDNQVVFLVDSLESLF